jgi:putative transposase
VTLYVFCPRSMASGAAFHRAYLLPRPEVNLSHVFAGQNVGVTQVGERVWLVTFMRYDLGSFDDETCRLEPIDNPFTPKVLPMSPE